jgi:hypothetical protein
MSETPSWLSDENIAVASKVAQNPVAQKAAVSAASNPVVQAAATNAALNAVGYVPPGGDVENQRQPVVAEPEDINIDPAELKEMQKYALALRVYYMGCSVLLSAAAWVYILNGGGDFTGFFIAFYTFFFAIQICCFELSLQACARIIASNFGFMYNGIGRGVYLIFVAALSFNLGDIGIAAMAMLLLGVLLNIVIVFQFPKYTAWLRKKHFDAVHKK